MWLFVALYCAFVVAYPSVPAQSSIDPNNPSAADPTSPPQSISFPLSTLKPSPIPIQPAQCNGQAPSEDCFSAMAANGGYIWYDNDSQCDKDQKDFIESAVWNAFTLADWASSSTDDSGSRGKAARDYYMGSDFPIFQERISGNLKRAADFKGSSSNSKTYITVSCKDTKNYCGKRTGNQAVGGYAWSSWGFWSYYHYITLCPPFFTLDTLSQKLTEIQDDLKRGGISKATDMRYLKNTGQYFLHELMHTRIAYDGEPEIIDEYIAAPRPDGKPHEGDAKAYGPAAVRKLAMNPFSKGGGATRASTNADSYAILANCLWWWSTTGYFPAAPRDVSNAQGNAKDDDSILSLYVSLGNVSDITKVDLDSLYNVELIGDAANSEDDSDHNNPQPAQSSTDTQVCHGISGDVYLLNSGIAIQNAKAFCSQSQMSMLFGGGTINDMQLSITAPPGSNKGVADSPNCLSKFVDGLIKGCDGNDPKNPYNSKYGGNITTSDGWMFSFEPRAKQGVADNCNTQWEWSVDTFDVRGINFDPQKLGPNGEGLKKQIEGCSNPVLYWNWELTPDDCCYQWHATGSIRVNSKGCLGRAVVSAGGNNNHCTGST